MRLIPSLLMCQLEKSEAPAPRFRRKHRPHGSESSSSTSEASTSSSHSSRRKTDTFYDDLLEEEPVTHIQDTNRSLTSTTVNSSCDVTESNQRANGLCENHSDTDDTLMIRPNSPAPAEDASGAPRNGCSDLTVPQLPSELEDLPHSDILGLTSDPHLSISWCRVYREDALLLVLFVCNATETPLRDVAVELSCDELEVSSEGVIAASNQTCFKIYCTY